MSSDEKLTPERAVHLLRAKGAELENKVLRGLGPTDIEVRYLAADIALIAQLLADHIERSERHDEHLRQMYGYLADHVGIPKRPSLETLLKGTEFEDWERQTRPQEWGPDHPDYDEMGQ